MTLKERQKQSDYIIPEPPLASLLEEPGTKYNLEERLIRFSLIIIEISESLPDTKTGNHFGSQILRSGTSPAFNYGEAQAAESRADFIHKIKICAKELKETRVGLKIILQKPLIQNQTITDRALKECNELIAIFTKSIETAKKNNSKQSKR